MKTEIIATIGPSSKKLSVLKKMARAGMSIGRINTKYAGIKEAEEIAKNLISVGCKVLVDIEFPDVKKSEKMLNFFRENNFDYLAVSFTSSKNQIDKIRKFLKPKKVFIISKIETLAGVKNIDEIIRGSDGLMVARGDLGKNVPLPKLPIFQKMIIKKCNEKNKFVITATEMLLSMVNSKKPTRAEVSDVSNAVLDGSCAVMLSEETAIGKYPTIAIRMMRNIVLETEKDMRKLK